MKANELIRLVEYMQTFGSKAPKPVRIKKEKRASPVSETIQLLRDLEDFQNYMKSKEKKDDKKDDKGWKLETINQAIILQIGGTFVGVLMAELVIRSMGLK